MGLEFFVCCKLHLALKSGHEKVSLKAIMAQTGSTFWARWARWRSRAFATDDGGVLTTISTFCISIYSNFRYEQPTFSYPSES